MHTSLKHIKSRGFTIVELLIVIVIIGILAGLSIMTFSGVQKQAVDKSVLSDVDAITGEEARYIQNNNGLAKAWYSGAGIDTDLDFLPTAGNIIDVAVQGPEYCIRAYNPKGTYTTFKNATIKESNAGVCHVILPSNAASAADPIVNQAVVTTFAGSSNGYIDATGTAAQFSGPIAVTVGVGGDVYVAANVRIRKITPQGDVTTFSGTGVSGLADGSSTNAQLNFVRAIESDASGNLYIADSNRIRKVLPNGAITTIAGSGALGYADGTGILAQFSTPQGIAVDSSGVIYVADTNNRRIRKVTPEGIVSTFLGSGVAGIVDGTGTSAQLYEPKGLAINPSGDLYFVDRNAIRKATATGVVTTIAGNTGSSSTSVNGNGSTVRFNFPMDIAVDSQGVGYVAEYGSSCSCVRKVTPSGDVTTFAGGGTGNIDGTGNAARFNYPQSIARNTNGLLYVVDFMSSRVRKVE